MYGLKFKDTNRLLTLGEVPHREHKKFIFLGDTCPDYEHILAYKKEELAHIWRMTFERNFADLGLKIEIDVVDNIYDI